MYLKLSCYKIARGMGQTLHACACCTSSSTAAWLVHCAVVSSRGMLSGLAAVALQQHVGPAVLAGCVPRHAGRLC